MPSRALAGPSCADARSRRAAVPPARPRRNRRRSMVAMVRQIRPSAMRPGVAELGFVRSLPESFGHGTGSDSALSSCCRGYRFERKEADMESIISNLLARFEKGSLSRRELVQGLAMLAAGSTAAAAQEDIEFGSANIDHVSI